MSESPFCSEENVQKMGALDPTKLWAKIFLSFSLKFKQKRKNLEFLTFNV